MKVVLYTLAGLFLLFFVAVCTTSDAAVECYSLKEKLSKTVKELKNPYLDNHQRAAILNRFQVQRDYIKQNFTANCEAR